MSVKLKSAIFRDLLYLHEIISNGQLSSVARQNGIKASNLSKLMKELEQTLQTKLWTRNARGVTPTQEALKLSTKVSELEEDFDKLVNGIINTSSANQLKIYIPENLHIKKIEQYSLEHGNQIIITCSDENNADVIVGYRPPVSNRDLIIVKNHIGNTVIQDIWVSCINTPAALELSEQIIRDLHQ